MQIDAVTAARTPTQRQDSIACLGRVSRADARRMDGPGSKRTNFHSRSRRFRTLLVALVMVGCCGGVGGRKTTLTVHDDSRAGFLVEPFCFAGGGTLKFDVTDFQLAADGKNVQPARVGVIVRRVDGAAAPFATTSAADRASSVCLITHKKPEDQVVFIKGPNTTFSQPVSEQAAGLYSLIYANCDAGTTASFVLKATLTNPDGVFLSAGDIPLPWIYGIFSALFTGWHPCHRSDAGAHNELGATYANDL